MDQAINALLTWQLLASAIVIFAIMSLLKKGLGVFKKSAVLLDKRWFQAFVLATLPLAIGVLIALIPGFLKGSEFSHRIVLGVCAGFSSQFLYAVVKKRLDRGTTPTKAAGAKPSSSEIEKPPDDIKKELDK